MKRIVDIDEKDYEVIKRECSNKDVVPIGWVQILNGKPLQTEYEEIKTDIHLSTVTGITGKTLVRVELVDEIIDNHIKELNNERE